MADLKCNPIITALGQYEGAVQVAGYVGRNENGRVRLYPKLDLAAYLEVDASNIIHVIDAVRDDEPARLFVRASAEVEVVSKFKVKAVAFRQKDDKEGGGGGKNCADESFDFWWKCVQQPGSNIDICTYVSGEVERDCESRKKHPDTAIR